MRILFTELLQLEEIPGLPCVHCFFEAIPKLISNARVQRPGGPRQTLQYLPAEVVVRPFRFAKLLQKPFGRRCYKPVFLHWAPTPSTHPNDHLPQFQSHPWAGSYSGVNVPSALLRSDQSSITSWSNTILTQTTGLHRCLSDTDGATFNAVILLGTPSFGDHFILIVLFTSLFIVLHHSGCYTKNSRH